MKTKKSSWGLLLFLIGHAVTYAQCVKNIKTNPLAPQNTEFNSLYPGKINPFINSFKWWEDMPLNPSAGWNIFGIGSGNVIINNPYSAANNPGSYLQNTLSTRQFEWKPEDGWELISIGSGYYPNGEAVNVANINRLPGVQTAKSIANPFVPYFILYNRYTSKLRIFANAHTQDLSTFNEAVMTLKYITSNNANNITGLLRGNGNFDRPLDQPTIIDKVVSYNKTNNNGLLWWMAEFQVSYDPCICNKQSFLNFSIKGLNQLNVNLYGRMLSTTQSLVNSYDLNHKDFLAAGPMRSGQEGAGLLYKSFDKMLDDYNTRLQSYDAQMADYNSTENQIKRQLLSLTKQAVNQGTGGLVGLLTDPLKDFINKNAITIFKKRYPANMPEAEKWSKGIVDATKTLLSKESDKLVMSWFDLPDKPASAPAMPTATFSEMRIIGTITGSYETDVLTLSTPGYQYTNTTEVTPFGYPVYNEALGLFALLETPKISMHRSSFVDQTQGFESSNLTLQFKEPLKYKLNNALPIDNSKSEVYVMFEAEYTSRDVTNAEDPNNMSNVFASGSFSLSHFTPITSGLKKMIYHTQWVPMSSIQSISDISNKLTKYVTGENTHPDNPWPPTFDLKKLKMKIMVDLTFSQNASNGQPATSVETFTYELFDTDKGVNNLLSASAPVVNDLTLGNQVFAPGSPNVTYQSGNTLYVEAKNIIIQGSISPASGYKLVIRGWNSVKVVTGGSVWYETNLVIGLPPFTQPTDAEISTYCQSKYKGNVSAAPARLSQDTDVISETEKNNLSFTAYPNPASDKIYVQVDQGEHASYQFKLYNLQGMLILDERSEGSDRPVFEIALDKLPTGLYVLHVASGDRQSTRKINIVR